MVPIRILLFLATVIFCSQSLQYFEEIKSYSTTCNVRDYGAKGDGKTNDTSSIQAAIDACYSSKSSAQVILPSGYTFLTGPLNLDYKCTDCAFSINSDTVLLVSNDRSKWPNNVDFLYIHDMVNFIFEGPGSIDGQGLVWWQNRNDFRPKIMNAHSSTNIVIRNILVKNCPNHCLEMYTDYTEIYNITILNPPSVLKNSNAESHNTDGIDVHGQPFYIHDSVINTGDDNVAMHANDTLIDNCHFGSGHGASIGSLSGGWLTNITVQNIVFYGTTPAARIKIDNNAGAGRLWNVVYKNLTMTDVSQTIVLTEYYSSNKNETCKFKVDDITFEGITSKQNGTKQVGQIACQPSFPCTNIVLKDIKITGGTQSWQCNEATVDANSVSPAISCTH